MRFYDLFLRQSWYHSQQLRRSARVPRPIQRWLPPRQPENTLNMERIESPLNPPKGIFSSDIYMAFLFLFCPVTSPTSFEREKGFLFLRRKIERKRKEHKGKLTPHVCGGSAKPNVSVGTPLC